jgi:type II secretory pathway pseudopilin PulG
VRHQPRRDERGDTLIELLIATTIIAITVSALFGALIGSITGSVEHRSLATLNTVLKSFAESAKYDIQLQPLVSGVSGPEYTECATSYRVLGGPSPSSGPVGAAVTLFGTGYAANSSLTVTIGSVFVPAAGVTSGSTSNGKGEVALTFTVPAGLAAGSYPVKVTDASGNSATSTDNFAVTSGGPVLSTSSLASYSVGITSIGWWDPASTPPFDPSTGTCGAADNTGIQKLSLTAVAGDHTTDTLDVVVTNPATTAPVITSATGTTFTVGVPGTFTVTATGYPSPVLTETGALPNGVTFNAGTGVLSGTPAAGTGGLYALTFTATNSAGTWTQNFTLTVNQPPAITSVTGTTFTVGTAGTFTVTAAGYPTPGLSESGALPSGVTFNPATAVVSGTPAAGTGGAYHITFSASNGVNPSSTQSFTLTVNQPPAITSATGTTFRVGAAETFTVTTTGYPSPALTEAGALPNGVTFNPATGVLSGTPAAGTGGSYPLTFTATSSSGTFNQSFTLTVNQGPAIASANNAAFATGVAGTFTVTATGNPAPALTEAGALPSGVTFNPATGVLSGTPAAGTNGAYIITFTATNSLGSTTQTFTLTVNQAQAPTITSANTATFSKNTSNSFTVTATGSPIPTLSESGALPSGVTFDPATGVLSGSPPANGKGTYAITFTAANGVNPNATQTFTLTVQ